MDEQKPKNKIASIRTYAQDLTNARERRTNVDTVVTSQAENLSPKALEETKSAEPIIETSLPPKVFARSNKVTPISKVSASPQDTLNDLVKNELKTAIPKITVPSGIEEPSATFVTNNEDAAAATIITDTKKDRFKLFPSILASIKSWFTDQKQAREQKKIPRYTVAETSRRKGVIQKATSSTGKTASADFASIQERIRQRKLAEASKVNEPETTWSANTEPGFLLLEAPEVAVPASVQNVVIVPKKSAQSIELKSATLSRTTQSTFTPSGPSGFEDPTYLAKTIPPPTPVEPVAVYSAPTPVNQTEVIPSVPKIVIPSAAEIVVTASDLSPKADLPVIEAVFDQAVQEETEVVAVTATVPTKNFFLSFETNFIALIASGFTIVLIVFGIYVYQTVSPVIPTKIFVEEQRFFSASELIKINLGTLTKAELAAKIYPLREEVTRATEIAINFNAVELDPKDSLSLFASNLPADFAHSLNLARPGFSSEQVPFLVMAITDKSIALGGLLNWEQTLFSDFTQVFSLKTPTPSASRFIDASLGGVDVRVLKNNTGEEILLYGILNNTILITTDSLTFSALAPIVNN